MDLECMLSHGARAGVRSLTLILVFFWLFSGEQRHDRLSRFKQGPFKFFRNGFQIFQNLIDANSYPEADTRYIREFVQQGAFAILCDWLKSEDPEPVSEIVEIFRLLRSKL